jgi:hypothetical protein
VATKPKAKPAPKLDRATYNKLLDDVFAIDEDDIPTGHLIERKPLPPDKPTK